MADVAEPTDDELRGAYAELRRLRPQAWPATAEEALADPIKRGILRARVVQLRNLADRRARAQVPVRYQRHDGEWRTRLVYGAPTDQLAIDRDEESQP